MIKRSCRIAVHHEDGDLAHSLSEHPHYFVSLPTRDVTVLWTASLQRLRVEAIVVGSTAIGRKPRIVSLPQIVCILGPVIHQSELKAARNRFPDVRVKFSEHLDHHVVFCTRGASPEFEGNLPDSHGFPRSPLPDPLRYFRV